MVQRQCSLCKWRMVVELGSMYKLGSSRDRVEPNTLRAHSSSEISLALLNINLGRISVLSAKASINSALQFVIWNSELLAVFKSIIQS